MATMIGKTISSLSQVPSPGAHAEAEAKQVREAASELLEDWKKVSKLEKKAQATVTPSAVVTPPSQPEEQKEAKATASGTTLKNGVFIPETLKVKTGDSQRDAMTLKFIEILQAPMP